MYPARVDDKGRLKLPVGFQQYFAGLAEKKLFVTSLDRKTGCIYPIEKWRENKRFFQENRGRRTFRDECKRFVFVNGDDHRKNVAGLFLSSCVKFLAERHDVDATRTERGPNRRGRISLARGNLEFDLCYFLFCHFEKLLVELIVDSCGS
jgi:hypothetical protein